MQCLCCGPTFLEHETFFLTAVMSCFQSKQFQAVSE